MAIVNIVAYAVHVYSGIIFVYCLLSWFPFESIQKVKNVLGFVVDPYLNLFRRFIPPIGGAVDISPIIAIVALEFIAQLILRVLINLFIV